MIPNEHNMTTKSGKSTTKNGYKTIYSVCLIPMQERWGGLQHPTGPLSHNVRELCQMVEWNCFAKNIETLNKGKCVLLL